MRESRVSSQTVQTARRSGIGKKLMEGEQVESWAERQERVNRERAERMAARRAEMEAEQTDN